MAENCIWSRECTNSTLKLFEANEYTDAVTGKYHIDDLEVVIKIKQNTISIDPRNLSKFKKYCRWPTLTDENTWLHTDPNVNENHDCYGCDEYIDNVEKALFLSMKGNNAGLRLLCSRCCYMLLKDLSYIPNEEVLAREI